MTEDPNTRPPVSGEAAGSVPMSEVEVLKERAAQRKARQLAQEAEHERQDVAVNGPVPRINPLVNFSVRQYVFSIGIFLAVVLLGLISTFRLGVDLLPSFEVPVLAINTIYSGATPDQVDREISKKVEDAVSTISGVADITSTSASGVSAVVITFQNGTNIDSAANSVSQKLSAIRGTLPNEADAPVVQKFDPNAQPIMTLALQSNGTKAEQVSSYAEDKLVPRLQRVTGVADIGLSGAPDREVQVLLSPSRLQSYNLSPARVTQAINASAQDLPAGTLNEDGKIISFSTRSTPSSISDIERILVDTSSGVTVGDVATVRDTLALPTSYARINGQPAVLLDIRKASGTNSVAVADAVRKNLTQLIPTLPKDYHLSIAQDTTLYTKSTVKDTFTEFLLGTLAVGIVVLLFLGRLSTVFAVILAIPISVSAAPLIYNLFGFTFNIISLLAIIVAIGIVVDDSIVVSENVQRYRKRGYGLVKSVLYGGSEVFSAVTAASFSLLAVLIPLSFMPGILGQFFRQFGLGLAAAIALSWLESLLFLTVRMAYTNDPEPLNWHTYGLLLRRLPQLLAWGWSKNGLLSAWGLIGLLAYAALLFMLAKTAGPVAYAGLLLWPLVLGVLRVVFSGLLGLFEAITTTLYGITNGAVMALARGYARTVAWLLPRNLLVIGIVALFLVVSVAVVLPRLSFAFTPKSDSGIISVSLDMPVGTGLSGTNAAAHQLEAYLLAQPEVKLVSTNVGAGSQVGTGANQSRLQVTLIPHSERADIDTLVDRYTPALKKALGNTEVDTLTVGSQQQGPGGSADISLALTAPNQTALKAANRDLMVLLAQDRNLSSVSSSLNATRQERNFVVNQAQLVGSGLTTSDLAQALRTYNSGTTAGTMRDQDKSVDIVVRLDPAAVQDEQSLLSQTVYSSVLQSNIPLGSLGSFRVQDAPATLNRYNKAYTATINLNLNKGVNAFDYQKTIVDSATKAGILTNGVSLGNASSFGSSGLTGDLIFYGPVVLLLAVFLNYLVLGSQFNSFRYPLYLMLPVPLALVGALWTLVLFGASLDIVTMLGMVILLGLATKNSILYLEFVVERMEHLTLREALIEAAELRFRPIIMTTVTVLAISLPLVFGHGDGAEFRRGLGIVILGGVITSTLLTFFVVPSIFYRFEKDRQYDEPTTDVTLPAHVVASD